MSIQDNNGRTPLMLFAASGKIEAVNYLLHKGADPYIRDQEEIYCMPLQRAVMSQSSQKCCHLVWMLIQKILEVTHR